MKHRAGVLFASDSAGRCAAPGSGFSPLYGFPRSLRIIVADDDKDTVLTLKTVLDDEGHDVTGFYNGTEALSAVRQSRPDVAILDIAMPDVNGYEIAKTIRDRYGAFHPLLIAISGLYTTRADQILSETVGFNHHLIKPCHPADLLALIAPLANPGAER